MVGREVGAAARKRKLTRQATLFEPLPRPTRPTATPRGHRWPVIVDSFGELSSRCSYLMAHQVLGHPWPTIDVHSNIQAQVRVLHDKCRACARAHTHTHVRASVYVHLPPLVHPSPIRSGSNCISACCLAPYSLLLTASMRRSFGERHGGGEARCHVRRALLAAAVGERCPVPAELALLAEVPARISRVGEHSGARNRIFGVRM